MCTMRHDAMPRGAIRYDKMPCQTTPHFPVCKQHCTVLYRIGLDFILSYTIPSYSALPYPTLPYPPLPYPTLPNPACPFSSLSYPALPDPTLPYPPMMCCAIAIAIA